MADVATRVGQLDDLDHAIAVWRAANTARRFGQAPSPAREAQVRRAALKPDAVLVVAEERSMIIGMALVVDELADDGAGSPIPGHAFLSLVFVAPERWGQGVGGQLVDAVLAEAQARGYEQIRLWTHAANERAQRLYEGRGFWLTGRELDDEFDERIVQYERAW